MNVKKLVDLNPRWVGAGGKGISDAQGNPATERHGIGIHFDCPCGCGTQCYLGLRNPLDGGPCLEPDRPSWQRVGDSFETMTLTPSIQRIGGCNWHGFITNGEIKDA